jgi:hypothetical protein
MKNNIPFLRPALLLFSLPAILSTQADRVSVAKSDDGMKLLVNGEVFMINGMNRD